MLTAWLEKLGALVVHCADGFEAVRHTIHFAPDWVLMDIEMPRLDGLTATRQITASGTKARVLILTQHDDDDSRRAALEAGACHFVPKARLELLSAILFPKGI